jgi:GNAT superfamily N-acetyltransferase
MDNILFIKNEQIGINQKLRTEYLKNLVEPQELFLEMMIWEADFYRIELRNEILGYFQVKDNIFLEYYIKNEHLPKSEIVFREVLKEFNVKSIYCKSFDYLLMINAISNFNKIKEIGCLFRDFNKYEFIERLDIAARFGTKADIENLESFIEGIFDNIEELLMVITNNNLIVFAKENIIVGFGIFQKTVPDFDWFDIGMAVHPDFRNKGIGSYIISYMKNYCEERGWRPTCGCDVKNIASKKTLEKAGIYSKHRLYEFVVK